jgi:hypothetical protein
MDWLLGVVASLSKHLIDPGKQTAIISMPDRETTLDDHSALSRKLVKNIEAFVDEAGSRGCTAHLEMVTTNENYLKGSNLTQQPERFVEDHLVFPILRTLGHTIRPRPVQYAPRWSSGRGIPDVAITTVPVETAQEDDLRLFCEIKPPNKLQYAKEQVKTYLQKDLDVDAFVILTDGIEWELWIRPRNEPLAVDDDGRYEPDASATLREALGNTKIRNTDNGAYHPHTARDELDATAFEAFTAPALLEAIKAETGVDYATLCGGSGG